MPTRPIILVGMDVRTAAAYVSTALECAVVVRLFASGISRHFAWFVTFLAADVIREAVFVALNASPNSSVYRRMWLTTEPLLLALQVAVAVELYRRLGSHYRNFGRIAPKLMTGAITVAAVLCAASITIDFPALRWSYPPMTIVIFAKRCTTFVLAAFLGCISVFFLRFRLPFRTNVRNHAWILATYLLINSGGYLVLDLGSRTYPVGAALMILDAICFLTWALFLSAAGEQFVHPPPVSDEERARTLKRRDQLLQVLRDT